MTLDTYNTGHFLKIDNSDNFFMYESIKILPTRTIINCPIMIGSLNFCDGTSLFYKLLENTFSRKNTYLKSVDLYACIGEVCYISLTVKNEQSLQNIRLNHVDALII